METILLSIVLALFGLVLGSFAAATVWRLRARQLVEDKRAGEPVDPKEYKKLIPLTKTTLRTDRSQCLHCGHVLAWYDLVPLVSWVALRGKCRYCQAPIGWFEPLTELGLASFFVISYLAWPLAFDGELAVAQFILWLLAGVLLAILFAYDLKWFLLPNSIMIPLIVVSGIIGAVQLTMATDIVGALLSLAGAIVILSGIYLILEKVSKGQWIGFGDVKLGLGLALLLGEWQLAFIALFAANLIGCLIVLPGMVTGKVTRATRIPFGPLLIMGAIVAMLAGPLIADWYMTYLL